tara:strand:+ start:2830 stop:3378 length:549 start_codon:yes stop_codon:yes gene_type:complete
MSDEVAIPRSCVQPRLHPPQLVFDLIGRGYHESLEVRETIAALAIAGFRGENDKWEELWKVADSMKKEVSVLLDQRFQAWVDIGTRGEVRLAPAVGSIAPYRLWLHTHPWSAYASSTDRETLASCSMILEQAIVLGHDHMVWLRRDYSGNEEVLEEEGPLSTWTTDEDVIAYSSITEAYDVE